MALPTIAEIQNLGYKEIQEKIIELKKEIFNLKLKQATRQSIKPHIFKHKKHMLCQLLTVEHNMNLKNDLIQ
uniref:ribosomal protein L29 n=1 Tax=Ahnfeltia fastigiata TaxID=31363 RepID=UPI001D0FDE87|nr:ribosomal protein L29 [Ahnfeltia fastigiata]UAT97687.1 ribosomal protein L29 [Ahnfeltia fastigiata]